MRIAITGASGFVGTHLAKALAAEAHTTVPIARSSGVSTDDVDALTGALAGCDAVAHCAGINRELHPGHYEQLHVKGTENVIAACKANGIKKLVLVSYYNSRPNCGSLYHETKWAAEELVRYSGLEYTILKPGMMYGRGDHMLTHISEVLQRMPIFGAVGLQEKPCYPLAIDDFIEITQVALLTNRLRNMALPLRGPDAIPLSAAVRKVAKQLHKPIVVIPIPVAVQFALAKTMEATMKMPLVTVAQISMLSEGFDEAYGPVDPVPADLVPRTHFTDEAIRAGLPRT